VTTHDADREARQPSSVELDRRAFRRRQSLRSVLISIASTLVLAVAAWVFLINTPGWAQVQRTFFDPQVFVAALPRVWDGFLLNLRVLFFAVIGVFVVAVLIAVIRTLRGPVFFPLRALAAGYTDLFRGMPLIIVLYLVGYGIPGLQGADGARIPAAVLGTIALILTYSAYVSEVFRAGIEAVHPSQRLAARSLGLTHAQSLRLVILPQAVRKVWFGGWAEVPVFWRDHLPPVLDLRGPAIIEQMDTTLVVEPGCRVTSDADGNLIVSVAG